MAGGAKATSPTRTPSRNRSRSHSRRSRSPRRKSRRVSVRLTSNSCRAHDADRSRRHSRGHSRSKRARNRGRRAHRDHSGRSRTPLRRTVQPQWPPQQPPPRPSQPSRSQQANGKDGGGRGGSSSYVQCKLCAKWLPNLAALQQHQRNSSYCLEKQGKGSAKKLCPVCSKPITNQECALQQHYVTSPSCAPEAQKRKGQVGNDSAREKPPKACKDDPIAPKVEPLEAAPPDPGLGPGLGTLASSLGTTSRGAQSSEDRNTHLANLLLNLGNLMKNP